MLYTLSANKGIKVSTEFNKFAESVIEKLQKEVGDNQLENDPVYLEIKQLLDNVSSNNFPDEKLRISFIAFDQQDDGIYKDDQLVKDIIHLEELYKILRKSSNS